MPFPYIRESLQAAVLSATSNILAQGIAAYREDRTFALDTTPITRFVTYAILNTPPNCAWQEWLEANFPGSAKPGAEQTHAAGSNMHEQKNDEKKRKNEKPSGTAETGKINVKNTLVKFGLDQTLGATFNTVAFVAGMGALKGLSWNEIIDAIQNDSLHIYAAGLKLWPAVSLLSFTIIPVEKRVLFGSFVGVAWGIFLSLQAAK